jgi:hypothetical protein
MDSSAPNGVNEPACRAGVVDAMECSITLGQLHLLKRRRTSTRRTADALVRVELWFGQQVDRGCVQQNCEPLSRCHFSVPPGSGEPHGLRTAR